MARSMMQAVAGAALALAFALPAHAQTPPPRKTSAGSPAPIFRAYVQFDFTAMSASQSFDAVLGSSSLTGFGGGGELLRLWKGTFVRVSFSSAGGSGSRAIVAGGEVVPLNIPVEVDLKTLTFGGGWRARVNPHAVVYGGAALVHLGYSEVSDFSTNQDSDESFNGAAVFGGVEIPIGRWLIVGGEVEWRTVPNALGDVASVSKAYGESNLGGTTIRVLVGIRK